MACLSVEKLAQRRFQNFIERLKSMGPVFIEFLGLLWTMGHERPDVKPAMQHQISALEVQRIARKCRRVVRIEYGY